jgi:hypothetical protein
LQGGFKETRMLVGKKYLFCTAVLRVNYLLCHTRDITGGRSADLRAKSFLKPEAFLMQPGC